jgi:hypothetical protein
MVLAVASCGALASCDDDATSGDATAMRSGATSPAVAVTPRRGPRGTVFTFHGTGWRPGVRVEAVYGPPCFTDHRGIRNCSTLGLTRRLKPDARGEFVFRFRDGARDEQEPEPFTTAGEGPVTFQQWKGKASHDPLVRRRAQYTMDE